MSKYDDNARARSWREGGGKAGWIIGTVYALGFAIILGLAYWVIR